MVEISKSQGFEEPHGSSEEASVPFNPPPPVPGSRIEEVIMRHRDELVAIDGVEGTDHGRAPDGSDAIRVHVRDEIAKERVPRELEGFPVIAIVTGEFEAY